MGTYIIRRLLIAIPIFFGITILVFMLLALAPGDPVSAFIRPELAGNEEMRRIITLRYGLDQPLPIRYIHWLAEALQGNLGYKLQGAGLPVLDTVARGLVASLILMGTALADRHLRRDPARRRVRPPAVLQARLRPDRRRLPGRSRSPRSCSGSAGSTCSG